MIIDKKTILYLAQEAGFGGQDRSSKITKITAFAKLVIEWNTKTNADLCVKLGDTFKDAKTEFADGQMDGSYQCAEYLLANLSRRTNPLGMFSQLSYEVKDITKQEVPDKPKKKTVSK